MKMVIVLRRDLNISCGKLAVQAAHAAVEATLRSLEVAKCKVKKWIEEGQKKIVVTVPDEAKLIDIYNKAVEANIVACLIRDAGLTEIPPGTLTAVGIGPEEEHIVDRITGMLPLLR